MPPPPPVNPFDRHFSQQTARLVAFFVGAGRARVGALPHSPSLGPLGTSASSTSLSASAVHRWPSIKPFVGDGPLQLSDGLPSKVAIIEERGQRSIPCPTATVSGLPGLTTEIEETVDLLCPENDLLGKSRIFCSIST